MWLVRWAPAETKFTTHRSTAATKVPQRNLLFVLIRFNISRDFILSVELGMDMLALQGCVGVRALASLRSAAASAGLP